MQPPDDVIRSCLAPYGVSVSSSLCLLVRKYLHLLEVWNLRISLTSIVDTKEILRINFGESMFAAQAVPIGHGRLADVGSGAGFPGLPLKLLLPDLQVSLIESNSRKGVFLSEVVRTLDLGAVEVTRARFQDFEETVPAFDFIACRALGR